MKITRPATLVTPELLELARRMLARGQDYSPEADSVLSTDNSLALCSYADGAWIVDTRSDAADMNTWTKLEFVLARL
ncbi:hypothetical protein DF016_10630 [Burkholderia stagnalis]|uniref:Uncharacterized protein n=1 Tax=Burkholderia stagnalis TaxID=1503054 RepID=A0ABX9YQ71_9BURK|nr:MULTISPECIES: hypothetical protein [Burkholderia]MDD1494036.1 hypothetical protein [Burkholderia thailandensis]RQY93795.1 hypothetical protein DF017_12210 [Burkholderia stagnalis]RQZ19517.1 hypothetical protein DF016_10630 [Burkholderia stagnalis]